MTDLSTLSLPDLLRVTAPLSDDPTPVPARREREAVKPPHKHQDKHHSDAVMLKCEGRYAVAGVPREEYEDFEGKAYLRREILWCLYYGNLPPGSLWCQMDGSDVRQVVGGYGTVQRLLPVIRMVRI